MDDTLAGPAPTETITPAERLHELIDALAIVYPPGVMFTAAEVCCEVVAALVSSGELYLHRRGLLRAILDHEIILWEGLQPTSMEAVLMIAADWTRQVEGTRKLVLADQLGRWQVRDL